MKFLISTGLRSSRRLAFTLVELIVVMGIIVVMIALVVPAVTSIARTNSVTRALYEVTGALENARTYAVANQTYVYVGFVQEDLTTENRTRLVMATIASRDGTRPYLTKTDAAKDMDMSANGPLRQIGKVIRIDDVRFVKRSDFPARDTSANDPLNVRPLAEPAGQTTPVNGIVPDDAEKTQYPFTLTSGIKPAVGNAYTFERMVEFAPDGACITNPKFNASSGAQRDVAPVNEIGLMPTRGLNATKTEADIVAVQYGGMIGQVKFYRPGMR